MTPENDRPKVKLSFDLQYLTPTQCDCFDKELDPWLGIPLLAPGVRAGRILQTVLSPRTFEIYCLPIIRELAAEFEAETAEGHYRRAELAVARGHAILLHQVLYIAWSRFMEPR